MKYSEIESLALYVDDLEEPLETEAEYCDRFKKMYQNFPDDVVTQWFFDHRQAIHQNSWLDYEKAKFQLKLFTSSELFNSSLYENPIVAQYSQHFENGNTSKRMERIASYVNKHGTWPRAPIILFNPDSKIVSPWGMRCDSPYHLLEGHHRFAVFYALTKKCEINKLHKVWLLS